jgi:membrane protein insertase Oxa1/YidC/SpoIIIJ
LRNNAWEPHVAELTELMSKTHDRQAKERYHAQILALQQRFPRRNRLVLPVISVGTTIFMWLGLRRMGILYPDEMTTGGIAWFSDLTQADHFLFLPIVSNLLMFAMREMGADEMGRPSKQITNKYLGYLAKGWAAVIFVVWFSLPASMHCFWIPNSTLSCLQCIVFSQPSVILGLGFGGGFRPKQIDQHSQEITYNTSTSRVKESAAAAKSTTTSVTESSKSPVPSINKGGTTKMQRRRR